MDYAKAAAAYPFHLSPDLAREYDREFGPLYSIGQSAQGTCQIEMISPPDRSVIRYRITRGGTVLHEWDGHALTTFRIDGDDLFYVLNTPSGEGGTAVAVDLRTGHVRWRKRLIGVGAIEHSAYFSRAKVSANRDAVTVEGDESGGRYVEFLDRGTGARLGHAKRGGSPWAN